MLSSIFSSMNNRFINDISKMINKNDTVLDLGCGDGLFAKKIQDKTKAKFILMDIVDYNKTNLPFHLYDSKKINFPDKHFDKVILCWVLHHMNSLQYQENVLKEVKRVVKGNIIIIETTPRNRFEWYINAVWDLISNKMNSVACSFKYRSHKNWLKLFKKLNMTIEFKKINHPMSSWIYIVSPIRKKPKN